MSTDEDGEDQFSILNRPSKWQSDEFKYIKSELDSKYNEIASERSKRMLNLKTRAVGDVSASPAPHVAPAQEWVVDIDHRS